MYKDSRDGSGNKGQSELPLGGEMDNGEPAHEDGWDLCDDAMRQEYEIGMLLAVVKASFKTGVEVKFSQTGGEESDSVTTGSVELLDAEEEEVGGLDRSPEWIDASSQLAWCIEGSSFDALGSGST